jgi:2-haloacid dehalogenase
MAGFGSLEVHGDVPEGIRRLAELGLRLVTLSNGSASVARGLLDRAGLVDHVELLLSVEDAGVWKPAPAAYHHAVQRCGVEPAEAMLVAVHPWDTDGARRAGLGSAWVNRDGGRFPGHFGSPDLEVASLVALAERLR